jgi:hypothetical protein
MKYTLSLICEKSFYGNEFQTSYDLQSIQQKRFVDDKGRGE